VFNEETRWSSSMSKVASVTAALAKGWTTRVAMSAAPGSASDRQGGTAGDAENVVSGGIAGPAQRFNRGRPIVLAPS
jgi:hypothetical protein